MTKRMLIDSTHAEETRVVVLDGNRLEDFDVETAAKAQLKGNIYLAKVVRVEPSLQAAFVEYGGGRHGFLAFGEIHPDYYQIPVADRQRLLEMQEAEARAEEAAEDAAAEAAEAAGEGRPRQRSAVRTTATVAEPAPADGGHAGTGEQAAAIARGCRYRRASVVAATDRLPPPAAASSTAAEPRRAWTAPAERCAQNPEAPPAEPVAAPRDARATGPTRQAVRRLRSTAHARIRLAC